jgi:nucleotide-binding universal stress UspA family protein
MKTVPGNQIYNFIDGNVQMNTYLMTMQDALQDFRRARQRAVARQILAKITGENNELLPFDEVRKLLRTQGRQERGIKEIPLEAIIGSVSRYEDFTRDFLPLGNVSPQRWANIEILVNGVAGLPPIEVYKLGEAYFVIDGNHRVSVARKYGASTIQAIVHEVPSRVALTPDDSMEDVLLKSEYAKFLEKTRLDFLKPGSDLMMTSAGQFYLLEEHIQVHQYYMGLDLKRDISYEEAVIHWYDTVYLPVIKIIRKQGLQHEFPGRTEADLYLWIAEHRAEIEQSLDDAIRTDLIADDLAQSQGSRFSRFTSALLPNTLGSGPPPGEWRQSREKTLEECCLFSDILVPVSGDETGWVALEQAILVAQQEHSRLRGIKIVASRNEKNLPENLAIQEKFNDRCREAAIPGKLALSAGPVARKIVENSRWNDLVIINLSHPPAPQQLSKLASGFRELVLRCPRPILAVPMSTTALKSALLAYDGSPKAEEALFVATYLSGKWAIPLTVLSVFEQESKVQAVQQHAQDYLNGHGVKADFVWSQGDVASAILATALERLCDFIIMGGYGEPPMVNLLLDTIVDRVMRNSHLPMLLCR